MTEHTEQITAQPDAIPAQVALEDFIEAVSRGITRAWAALDDVGGYQLGAVPSPVYSFGFVVECRPPVAPLDPRAPTAGQSVSVRQGL